MGSTSNVREVEVDDFDVLLGTKAATVIAPTEDSKRTVLESTSVDTSFLDKMHEDGDEPPVIVNTPTAGTKDALANVLDADLEDEEEEEEDPIPGTTNQKAPQQKAGRKPGLVEIADKLAKKGLINLFDDNSDLSTYSLEDFEELFESNIIAKVNEVAQAAPLEIFGRLDPKLQDVISYALNGGTDITNVLKNVARSQEITELSLDTQEDQERICREWLRETDFGTDEEIESEITAYIDRNDLEKKASQFKPKLDKKQATIMEAKLREQEDKRAMAEEVKKTYALKIFNTLNNNELNGLKLNNRIQTALYYGITDVTQYQDREGNPTNELGYLIEKYQLDKEADNTVLLEALWLLKDPAGYRQSVLAIGEQQAHGRTYRSLKTAEGERTTSAGKQGEERGTPSRGTIQRNKNKNSRSIFDRGTN